MTVSTYDEPKKQTADARKKAAMEYQRVVFALSEQIKGWVSSAPGWTVTEEVVIERPPQTGGGFFVPKTTLDTPQGCLLLEPQGFSFGGRAVVEFRAYPSSYNVRLLHDLSEGGTWRVLTNSGIYLHDEWNRENFLRLALDLLHADWQ